MGRRMTRGKQQVLFNYLPGRTFDFEHIGAIARVKEIRGAPRNDLNSELLLRRIAESARAWDEAYRPGLRDDVLNDPSRFVFIDPAEVQAEIFPKVLWCQNRSCGRVTDFSRKDTMPVSCTACNTGILVQLRFVKIHRCGALEPLLPPRCPQCGSANHLLLDTRGSERISEFLWKCGKCKSKVTMFAGKCRECQWPGDPKLRNMDIEVHRAGRTFYAHTAVLLNVPRRDLDRFFTAADWQMLTAAKFLDIPEVIGRSLTDLVPMSAPVQGQTPGLSGVELEDLLRRQAAGELSAEQVVQEMQKLKQEKSEQARATSAGTLSKAVVERTGVERQVWERAGHALFEVVLHKESGHTEELLETDGTVVAECARSMGLEAVTLISEFPIITATYGYSRAEYIPQECRLNPFPPSRQEGGRLPIFVDQVQADALLLRLDEKRVLNWIKANGFAPVMPSGRDPEMSIRAFFVRLLEGISLYETVPVTAPEARLVFGLLHTLSHLSVRRAALLCGLDHTSLSEYLFPRALRFALYCNHRFGATIGALSALFEQAAEQWLQAIRDSTHCVYDPVCCETVGNCHACSHLAETSCRFFNLNLNRSFLFGGPDPVLGQVHVGFFDRKLV